MKFVLICFLALACTCAFAQFDPKRQLFGDVLDLSSRPQTSCFRPLFDIFGPGCDNVTGCHIPNHGVGITITTSNNRTKETTFLRGCLQIDTFPTGLVLTNIARPEFWGVLSSERMSCCAGRGQPFDVTQSTFSINYIEIDQRGNVFVRSNEGLTVNFTLICPFCDSFPAMAFVGELVIIFQFSLFPGTVCPDVPINQACNGPQCPTCSPSPAPPPCDCPPIPPTPTPQPCNCPTPTPVPSPSPSPIPSPSPPTTTGGDGDDTA